MAYSEELAERAREILRDEPGLSERKMFGGLAFMLSGNMCCGPMDDELMVRCGPDAYEECLSKDECREMDFTGKPMKGMVTVSADGIASEDDLRHWINYGIDFAGALPPK